MNKTVKKILIIITVPLWLNFLLNAYKIIKQDKKDYKKDFLEVYGYFKTDNLTEADERYYKLSAEILGAYSKLSREKRITYIKEAKAAADVLGKPRYWVYGISYLETSFNDHGKHDFGETGINGIKYQTALLAELIQKKFMPSHIANKIPIKIKSKNDLKDIALSIRVTMTLLWYYTEYVYDGSEMWAVSVYHWGGFLDKYWGIKKIPEHFTLNKIKYSVINYYLAWRDIVGAFEKGYLEQAANIYSRHEKYKHQLNKKEITYRNMYKILKGYEKRIKEFEKIVDQKDRAYEELKNYNEKSIKEMHKISGDAKKGFAKEMVNRVKNVARKFIKEVSKNVKKNN